MSDTVLLGSGITFDESTFIQQYVTTFLATRAAMAIDNACATGNHKIFDRPEIEDAFCIAEKAWEFLRKNPDLT